MIQRKPTTKKQKPVNKKYPNFWRAVSQFCRDKNSEKGVDYLIGAWLCDSPEDFEKKFPNISMFEKAI